MPRIVAVAVGGQSWRSKDDRDSVRVGRLLSGVQRVAQRAEPSPAGGEMVVYSSNSGSLLSLPAALSYDAVK